MAYWTPWALAESRRQARIDAHHVRVTGRITDVDTGRYGTSARAAYTIGGRQVTSDAFSVPGYYA